MVIRLEIKTNLLDYIIVEKLSGGIGLEVEIFIGSERNHGAGDRRAKFHDAEFVGYVRHFCEGVPLGVAQCAGQVT